MKDLTFFMKDHEEKCLLFVQSGTMADNKNRKSNRIGMLPDNPLCSVEEVSEELEKKEEANITVERQRNVFWRENGSKRHCRRTNRRRVAGIPTLDQISEESV